MNSTPHFTVFKRFSPFDRYKKNIAYCMVYACHGLETVQLKRVTTYFLLTSFELPTNPSNTESVWNPSKSGESVALIFIDNPSITISIFQWFKYSTLLVLFLECDSIYSVFLHIDWFPQKKVEFWLKRCYF